MKLPGVCPLESDDYISTLSRSSSVRGNRSHKPSAFDYDNWWKYIEVRKWSDQEKQWKSILPSTDEHSTPIDMVYQRKWFCSRQLFKKAKYLMVQDTTIMTRRQISSIGFGKTLELCLWCLPVILDIRVRLWYPEVALVQMASKWQQRSWGPYLSNSTIDSWVA